MKYFLLLGGITLSTIGLTYIVIYLNLLIMGYNIIDYLKYIFTNIESLLFFIGYVMIILYLRKENK